MLWRAMAASVGAGRLVLDALWLVLRSLLLLVREHVGEAQQKVECDGEPPFMRDDQSCSTGPQLMEMWLLGVSARSSSGLVEMER